MAASDWRKELLCKHDSWHRGSCCGLDLPVSGNPRPFRWPESPFREGVFSEAVSVSPFGFPGRVSKNLFHCFDYKRKTRNCNCDVQFLLVHFVHGLSRKLEIRHFLESCWWWFRAHFPEILNAMLVAREGRWFSVSISSKRVYIYMSLLHCKHFYTCFKI